MYWDASKPTRNGSFISISIQDEKLILVFSSQYMETQMPTEGTGFYSPYPEDKPMAQVTYRGVVYDSEEYNAKVLEEAAKRNRHDLMYRGIKVERKFASKS